ncbi:hypothetical protein [Microbacterium sp.]|uniref:hypothetical protein n=1 Tax=Microbacterium sp. TaxID=51671 RepID=UPI0025E6961F|nr:hypothetical protein [Microbacterium sp.]MBT9608145.1 hypothetical protein [Microbacterium sp.]
MDSGDWIAVGAVGVSVVALALSWFAYRQTARYHPQPKLVLEWEGELRGVVVPLYRVWIANHGDAAATDLEFFVETAVRYPEAWDDRLRLEPGESWPCDVPLRDRAARGEGAEGTVWFGEEREVRPRVLLTWRQAPFSGPKKCMSAITPARDLSER